MAPGIGILFAMMDHAAPWGIDRKKAIEMGYEIEIAAAVESLKKMHKRGIRVLPGGDYGFAFTPHCDNARDLEYFVKHLGFTPMEAIVSTTKLGAEIMMQGGELGQIKDGYLADLLLVDGDPLSNLAILRDQKKILAVMKDGTFYKQPEIASARSRWAAVGGVMAVVMIADVDNRRLSPLMLLSPARGRGWGEGATHVDSPSPSLSP